MERGLVMLLHSAAIGLVLYVLMVYALNQSPLVAENRSIIIACVVLIYMIVFGHGMPKRINRNL